MCTTRRQIPASASANQGRDQGDLIVHRGLAGGRERVLYEQFTCPNPLIHRDDFSRTALRHRSLNSLFQVANSYLSKAGGDLVAGDASVDLVLLVLRGLSTKRIV